MISSATIPQVLGCTGKVEDVDEEGDIYVNFGESSWYFNPDCLVKTDGTSSGNGDGSMVDNQSKDDDIQQEPACKIIVFVYRISVCLSVF